MTIQIAVKCLAVNNSDSRLYVYSSQFVFIPVVLLLLFSKSIDVNRH